MEVIIDTADINEIKELDSLLNVDGVTTNPTIITRSGKTPEEAIAGAMGHYGQWENAAKYIDPRTDEETHSVASVFPVHE